MADAGMAADTVRAAAGSGCAARLQRGVVVKAAAAVHDARAVVLPDARAVERLVVPEVGLGDIACLQNIVRFSV